VAVLNAELAPKRLELLHQVVPTGKLIAYLSNPENPAFAGDELMAVQNAARILGLNLLILNASTASEIDVELHSKT
jgi:putative tryptophan/tyrosine transport system substrate-binding protein